MENYQEFIAKIKSNDKKLQSTYGLRNKEKRLSVNGGRIPFFKKEKNKQAKLLIPIDYFETRNPLTLVEDDEYNKQNEFRPEDSFTSTALNLKKYYNENEDMKNRFMEIHGIEKWDTSNTDEITLEDIKALKPVRDQRILYYTVRNIKDKNITGSEFAQPYRLNHLRNDFGKFVNESGEEIETPEIVKLANMYNEVFTIKYNEWLDNNKNASTEKKSSKRMEIFSDVPVSGEKRYEVIYALELPLDEESKVTGLDSIHKLTLEQLNSKLVLLRVTASLATTLKSFAVKNKKRDVYADFIEIDVSVGDEEKASDRGKNTQYTVANNALIDYREQEDNESDEQYEAAKKAYKDNLPVFLDNFRKLLDDQENIEVTVTRSAVSRQLSDNLVSDLYKSLETTIPFEEIGEYLTNTIVDKYSDMLGDIYGDKANVALVKAEMGALMDVEVSDEVKDDVKKTLADSVNTVELDEEE